MSETTTRDREAWEPAMGALNLQLLTDPGTGDPGVVLLQHPNAPFQDPGSFDDDKAVFKVAFQYLLEATALLKLPLPHHWRAALDPAAPADLTFGWLPILRIKPKPNPMRMVRIRSPLIQTNDGTNRAIILSATEVAAGHALGSEVGLRIVVNTDARATGRNGIRITGLSARLPGPSTVYDALDLIGDRETQARLFIEILLAAQPAIAKSVGAEGNDLTIRGVRGVTGSDGHPLIEVRSRGVIDSGTAGPRQPYETFSTLELTGGTNFEVRGTRTVLLSACGTPKVGVFRCDPVSHASPTNWLERRPTRKQELLEVELEQKLIPNKLEDPDRLNVVQTWFVLGDIPGPAGNATKNVIVPPQPRIRSNDFSADSADWNVSQIFAYFDLFAQSPPDYFTHATLPLEVHYRSGVRPGPGKDGQTVNGRVLPKTWDVHDVARFRADEAEQPVLELHLALGDLRVRERAAWDPTTNPIERVQAQPLGFAADPRFMWHEASHVLLMAALGELELRFAHSMGDGLAAIVADPSSLLTDNVRWRGYTFPWVHAPRRHDRCVLHGWGWAGLIGRSAREVPLGQRVRRKGYLTEQILSTSLFRMYRCLGGDTVLAGTPNPDRDMRRRASDYAVWLILRGLQMFGEPLVVPPDTAEQYVDGLVQADQSTDQVATRDETGAKFTRIGAAAWKAIVWAFEAQGMFAAAGEDNTPGLPPKVDVFIADRRPLTETFPDATVTYDAGSYVPVSLDWAGLTPGSTGVRPLWFADDAIMAVTAGTLNVSVGNRGTTKATSVTVNLWSHQWIAGDPPDWDHTTWTREGSDGPLDIAAGASAAFAIALVSAPPPGGSLLLLAEVSCGDDPDNINPLNLHASAQNPIPLNEVVALDNNLALIALPPTA